MLTLIIAIAVLVVDLGSKTLAQDGLLAAAWIVPSSNPDLALGVAGASAGTEVILGLAFLGIGVVTLRRRRPGAPGTLAAGLIIGGSVGNLADRLLLGAVRDFIAGPFIVFNLADVALLVGFVVVLWNARSTKRHARASA